MKKIILGIMFIFIISSVAFAQNGYLDFRWGMTLDEVKNLLDDNYRNRIGRESLGYDPVIFLMYYLYGSEIRNNFGGNLRSPPEQLNINGTWQRRYIPFSSSGYTNWNTEGYCFYLENERLIGVQTTFSNGNIIDELVKRHGDGNRINVQGYQYGYMYNDYRIWISNNRIIIYYYVRHNSMNWTKEIVSYLDSESFRRIAEDSMIENRILLNNERRRID